MMVALKARFGFVSPFLLYKIEEFVNRHRQAWFSNFGRIKSTKVKQLISINTIE